MPSLADVNVPLLCALVQLDVQSSTGRDRVCGEMWPSRVFPHRVVDPLTSRQAWRRSAARVAAQAPLPARALPMVPCLLDADPHMTCVS